MTLAFFQLSFISSFPTGQVSLLMSERSREHAERFFVGPILVQVSSNSKDMYHRVPRKIP